MTLSDEAYSLSQVLAVARCHPFYSNNHQFPPNKEQIADIAANAEIDIQIDALGCFPKTLKDDLYKTILRLCEDDDPRNTYKQSVYVSTTGGGSGLSMPMLFLADAQENRRQRLAIGVLAGRCHVIDENDWVLVMHTSGNLYRSLDLVAELIENAGGSALLAGATMPLHDLQALYQTYKPNVLCGDSSQIMEFTNYIASQMGSADTNCHKSNDEAIPAVKFDKILYTSEPLTATQRRYITSILSRKPNQLRFSSLFASAEAGPWCVGNASITGEVSDDAADFLFDTRHMIVEIQPLESNSPHVVLNPSESTLPTGRIGSIIITSLQRLRHPLVRYDTGDIGSLHELPQPAATQIEGDTTNLRILRLYGRDIRQSFKWHGEYFELKTIAEVMQTPEWTVLKWQIVTGIDDDASQSHYLEIRLLREIKSNASLHDEIITDSKLRTLLARVFFVTDKVDHLFRVVYVNDINGFERSSTGRKIMKFLDKRHVREQSTV